MDVVVLSISNIRAIRTLLSPFFLSRIPKEYFVAIICPQDLREPIISNMRFFSGCCYKIINYNPASLPIFLSIAAKSLEKFRFAIFYALNRRHPFVASSYANIFAQIHQANQSWLGCILIFIFKSAFLLLSQPLAKHIYYLLAGLMTKLSLRYVIDDKSLLNKARYFFYSANWGVQDLFLSTFFGSRVLSYLVPYTTDQLWVNGLLSSSSIKILAQGRFEFVCAKELHQHPKRNVFIAGSMWFRYIDCILAEEKLFQKCSKSYIVYAGVSPCFYPRENEIRTLNALIQSCESGLLKGFTVIYRPYIESREEYFAVRDLMPVSDCLAIDETLLPFLDNRSFAHEANVIYVKSLLNASVVITSHTTTLSMDACYLGSGIVANFADPLSLLNRSSLDLRFNDQLQSYWWPSMPVAFDLDQLIYLAYSQSTSQDARDKVRSSLLQEWDSPSTLLNSHFSLNYLIDEH